MSDKKYDNTNRGAVWKNSDKKSETHPDFKGNLNVDGVEYFLDFWANDPEGRRPDFSVQVKKKDKQPGGYTPAVDDGSAPF